MQNLLRSSLVAAAAAALASLAGAQTYTGQVPMYTYVLEQPSGYVSGTCSAVVAGQFSDDAIPDAVALMDGAAHFLYAPDRRNSWHTVGSGYTSIAARPNGGTASRDDVLATSSTGLQRLCWNDSTGVWAMTASSVPGTAAFSNAKCLQVVHVFGNIYEVVALHAAPKFLVRATWDALTGSISGVTTVAIDNDTTDMLAVQWDADLEPEYVSVTGTRLRISDHNGAILGLVSSGNLGSALTRVPMASGPDRVAWARHNGQDSVLSVVYGSGNEDSVSYFNGAIVDSMDLMDVDDGESELVVFSNTLPIALAMTRGVSDTFYPWPATAAQVIDLDRAHSLGYYLDSICEPGTGAYGANMLAPAHVVTDFDGDGDDDLFVVGHADSAGAKRALIHCGSVHDEEADFDDDWRTRAWLPSYEFEIIGDTMELSFEAPVRPTLTANPASDATHVRIVAWVKHSASPYVEQQATDVLLFDLDQLPVEGLGLTVPELDALDSNGEIHLEISYLRYEGGQMVRAYPAYYEDLMLSHYPGSGKTVLFDRNYVPPEDFGIPASGSTERPPLQPPSSGGGGTTTP